MTNVKNELLAIATKPTGKIWNIVKLVDMGNIQIIVYGHLFFLIREDLNEIN